jgi:hypothetical protein
MDMKLEEDWLSLEFQVDILQKATKAESSNTKTDTTISRLRV